MTAANVVDAGDQRRAAALLWFAHGEPNAEGLVAILQEAQEDHRAVQVVMALLSLVGAVAPFLRTPEGRQWMRTLLDTAAQYEADRLAGGEDQP